MPLNIFRQGMIDEQLALVMIGGRIGEIAEAFGVRE